MINLKAFRTRRWLLEQMPPPPPPPPPSEAEAEAVSLVRCVPCGTWFLPAPGLGEVTSPPVCPACEEHQATMSRIHRFGAAWVS